MARPDVELVYVADRHRQHHALAMLAIAAGEYVLVEKPIAVSAKGAEELAYGARAATVVAAEAMWTRYLPQLDVLAQVIGAVSSARCGSRRPRSAGRPPTRLLLASSTRRRAAAPRWTWASTATGSPTSRVGRAETVRALVRTHPSGLDKQSVVALESADGRQAVVSTSTGVKNSGLATAVGSARSARFVWPFVFPSSFVADVASGSHRWDDTTELVLRKGLGWQTCAITGFVADGLTASPVHSLADAVDVLRVIDGVRS